MLPERNVLTLSKHLLCRKNLRGYWCAQWVGDRSFKPNKISAISASIQRFLFIQRAIKHCGKQFGLNHKTRKQLYVIIRRQADKTQRHPCARVTGFKIWFRSLGSEGWLLRDVRYLQGRSHGKVLPWLKWKQKKQRLRLCLSTRSWKSGGMHTLLSFLRQIKWRTWSSVRAICFLQGRVVDPRGGKTSAFMMKRVESLYIISFYVQ